jgi:hypothetical protein
MVKMLIECESMPKKNDFALTVDANTGYISLPNHNKHEEIDGKNTQMLAFDCSIDQVIRNRIYTIHTASPQKQR